MAEPRKVQFVTLSAFAAGAAAESRKRQLDDEADFNFGRAGEVEAAAATGAGGVASNGRLGKTGERDTAGVEKRTTVRLNLPLCEPNDRTSAEFNYGELLQNIQVRSPNFTNTTRPGNTGAGVNLIALWNVCVDLSLLNKGGSAPCPSVDECVWK